MREKALELGFHAVGFAAAASPPTADFERFQAFVRRGWHGEMHYLAAHAAARGRVDGPEILRGAATVVSVALRYAPVEESEQQVPPLARAIARYARGRDYHRVIKRRLDELAAFVASLAPGARSRALCDTAPVLERAWAVRAGLGAVGKNGMLIVPDHGSYVLLGELVTTLELAVVEPQPVVDPCGECSLCLSACPAGALVAPYVLDPRSCLSYATIESRDATVPAPPAAPITQLFGCDRCQESCPHNQLPPLPAAAAEPFRASGRWAGLDLGDLLNQTPGDWADLRRTTALERLSHEQLVRNTLWLVAARGRRGDAGAARLLEAASVHPTEAARRLARALQAQLASDPGEVRLHRPQGETADSD